MMETTLGVIFVIIFVSAVSVYSLGITTVNFQMLQQHPQLRKCAESVLQENRYFGCRVSRLTGQCQGLTRAWGLNPEIEQGYAYAKKLVVQDGFQPSPLKLSKVRSTWQIPVVLNTGARIDVSMSIPSWVRGSESEEREVFFLNLNNGSSWEWYDKEAGHWFKIRAMDTLIEIFEIFIKYPTYNWLSEQDVSSDRMTAPFSSEEIIKISLLARTNSLAIFVEDEEIATLKLSTHIRIMTQMALKLGTGLLDIFIYGVKFTGVLE